MASRCVSVPRRLTQRSVKTSLWAANWPHSADIYFHPKTAWPRGRPRQPSRKRGLLVVSCLALLCGNSSSDNERASSAAARLGRQKEGSLCCQLSGTVPSPTSKCVIHGPCYTRCRWDTMQGMLPTYPDPRTLPSVHTGNVNILARAQPWAEFRASLPGCRWSLPFTLKAHLADTGCPALGRAQCRCPAHNVFGASGSQIESVHQNLDSGTGCGPIVEAKHPTWTDCFSLATRVATASHASRDL